MRSERSMTRGMKRSASVFPLHTFSRLHVPVPRKQWHIAKLHCKPPPALEASSNHRSATKSPQPSAVQIQLRQQVWRRSWQQVWRRPLDFANSNPEPVACADRSIKKWPRACRKESCRIKHALASVVQNLEASRSDPCNKKLVTSLPRTLHMI